MFKSMEIMRMAQAMSEHAATRQSVISRNVANADTPGYRAQDVADFADTYRVDKTAALRQTRAGHINPAGDGMSAVVPQDVAAELSPNGNSVSLETEMVKSVNAKRQHDMALAIYSSSLGILRSSLGRR